MVKFCKTSKTEILWPRYSPRWFREDNNARNSSREKKQRKAKTKMGERHQRYVCTKRISDGSSKQSGGGQASVSQRHLGSEVLTRICSEKKMPQIHSSRMNGKCWHWWHDIALRAARLPASLSVANLDALLA